MMERIHTKVIVENKTGIIIEMKEVKQEEIDYVIRNEYFEIYPIQFIIKKNAIIETNLILVPDVIKGFDYIYFANEDIKNVSSETFRLSIKAKYQKFQTSIIVKSNDNISKVQTVNFFETERLKSNSKLLEIKTIRIDKTNEEGIRIREIYKIKKYEMNDGNILFFIDLPDEEKAFDLISNILFSEKKSN